MSIDTQLEKMLRKVEKPARYTGGEVNSVKKDPEQVSVRFGFAFPDTYEIGMSYMGMQILYNILNRNEKIYCERIFAPAEDMEALMREEGRKLFTLETFTSVDELDIVGFTLQYELSYTNVLNILDLSGMPLHSADRGEEFPVIVAGGPCAYNPEPLADFIDLFMIGDGEELLEQVCLLKMECDSKKEFLQRACKLQGVYVPAFYEPIYNEDGTIKEIKKLYEEAPDRVKRAVVEDLDKAEFPVKNIVPFIDTVHDRCVVETFRGCTRGCRFCQAGMIYRPVRERKKETIENLAKEQLANTGHEELSLLSLSTSDYSQFEPLATDLMKMCGENNISLSLPSLRLDSFSFQVLQEIQKYRKSGLTFAPEAGSQRLRDVINKNITEENIFSAVEQAIELGWEHIKFYFMDGLPGETYEDLDGIGKIASNIMDLNFKLKGRRGGRFRVTVSVSNFVPKAHTPFQWAAQITPEEYLRRVHLLQSCLTARGVDYRYHESDLSRLEAVLARGDRRLSRVLLRAHELGCKLDGWDEYFRYDLWLQAFSDCGVDPDFYTTRGFAEDEILPWQTMDVGVSRAFFLRERALAYQSVTTPDCRTKCAGCGARALSERGVCDE